MPEHASGYTGLPAQQSQHAHTLDPGATPQYPPPPQSSTSSSSSSTLASLPVPHPKSEERPATQPPLYTPGNRPRPMITAASVVDISSLQLALKPLLDAQEKRLRTSFVNQLNAMTDIIVESHSKVIEATNTLLAQQKGQKEALENVEKKTADVINVQAQLDSLFDEMGNIRQHLDYIGDRLPPGAGEQTFYDGEDEAEVEAKILKASTDSIISDDRSNRSSRGPSADLDAEGEPEFDQGFDPGFETRTCFLFPPVAFRSASQPWF